MLMQQTEALARQTGIALYPGRAEVYCRYDDETGIQWVFSLKGSVGLSVTMRRMDSDQAADTLRRLSEGFLFD
ncbi:hypothetical protein D0B32_02105 [Paraburkholderia sp. DHOC27]|nr:hypothetical protein D0B32_02105 [Paraburkholderia sp. DHOC27]